MDLPFDKSKKIKKDEIYTKKTRNDLINKKSYLKKESPSILTMCNKLRQSIVKDCFIDVFTEEKEPSLPEKTYPYLNSISIGNLELYDDQTNLVNTLHFKEKLRKTLSAMGLLSESEENSEYTLDVSIISCINVVFNLEKDKYFKHLIRTNIMVKYTIIRKSDGKIFCELWYQGKGDKKVAEVNEELKNETLNIAYENNLNYIFNLLKTNSF